MSENIPNIPHTENKGGEAPVVPGEMQVLIPQTEDVVAGILDSQIELFDDQMMLEKLTKLEKDLVSALKLYGEQYNQDFGNIQAMEMAIRYPFGNFTKGLDPGIVEIQAIFAGLHGVEISDEERVVFQDFLSKFMRKSPEIQASMLYWFDTVDTYVTPKNREANKKSLEANLYKKVLFHSTTMSYYRWIAKIFEEFGHDEDSMTSLSDAICDAQKGGVREKDIQKAELIRVTLDLD